MNIALIIALFVLGVFLISKGADYFVNCTVEIGKRTNISELILGATLVSFATTLPELTVSLLASLDGHTTMSLGNAVGSIICNTGLILGLVIVISPFKVDRNLFIPKAAFLIISVIMLIILGMDGQIFGFDSLILLGMMAYYLYNNYRSATKDQPKNARLKTDVHIKPAKKPGNKKENLKLVVMFIGGLIMMFIGSRLLIDNGVIIAEMLGVPQGIVSLTVIALGTSLPELVASLTAVMKKHHALSVGNILGANILNIISVIGISSIPNSIPILSQTIRIDYPFMIVLLMLLILPTLKGNKVRRWQGFAMLSTYAIYIFTLYTMYL
jgi:cation:H+ antiporter